MRRGLFCAALVAIGFAGLATVSAGARPVSRRLLELLESGPISFRLAGPAARPEISGAVASRDAASEVQWRPAQARGASLVRIGSREGVPAGTLAWLVALKPRHPLRNGRGVPAANYMVAFVRASDGRIVAEAAGYSPELAGRTPGPSWAMGALGSPPTRRGH